MQVAVDNEPSGAVFTDDRTHRLYLWRRWSKERPWVMFIGLNPSTADERLNDPTLRRCMGFATRWGYGGMFMCNVFTLVSTDPKKLNTETPIVNEVHLAMKVIRNRCKEAVAAWGGLITQVKIGEEITNRIKRDLAPLHCLGMTKDGHPRHPLYLPYSASLVSFESRKREGV